MAVAAQFAVLYDTWQQGDGFSSGDKPRVAAGSKSSSDDPSNETEEQRREREGKRDRGDVGREHQEQTALLEREVEEEDRGERLLFSYAVLTTSAAPRLEWLHERCLGRRNAVGAN